MIPAYKKCCTMDFRVVYTLLLNDKGGVEADLTVSIIDGGQGQLHEPIFKVSCWDKWETWVGSHS